jgi:hypothetical protein
MRGFFILEDEDLVRKGKLVRRYCIGELAGEYPSLRSGQGPLPYLLKSLSEMRGFFILEMADWLKEKEIDTPARPLVLHPPTGGRVSFASLRTGSAAIFIKDPFRNERLFYFGRSVEW